MADSRKFVVIVGDEACGKSCLFENDHSDVQVTDGQRCRLVFHDTPGHSAFDRVRPIGYMHADLFLLCFSIDSPDSLTNVFKWWHPEVKRYCPGVPVILVGTKKDLRSDLATIGDLGKVEKSVGTVDGQRMAERLRAFAYVETSGQTREGISELLHAAAKAPIVPRNVKLAKERHCVVM